MGVPTTALVGTSRPHIRQKLTNSSAGVRETFVNFTFSTTYATNGEAFDPATTYSSMVRGTILAVEVVPKGGWTFDWDATNKKLKAYVSGGTEVTNAVNLSVTPGALLVRILSA